MKNLCISIFLGMFLGCALMPGFGESPENIEEIPREIVVADTAQIDTTKQAISDTISRQRIEKVSGQMGKQFFRVEKDIAEIHTELSRLKQSVAHYDVIRRFEVFKREIYSLFDGGDNQTHEIEMNYGTTIKGKIIDQALDTIVLQTSIGDLRLERSQIKNIRQIEKPRAHCVLDGELQESFEENVFSFSGKVQNEGDVRADFVRVVFMLSDEQTNTILTDSCFVAGSVVRFESGVISDTSLEPEQHGRFSLQIELPEETTCEYHTYEIHWD